MSPRGRIAARHIWKRFPIEQRRRLLQDEVGRLLDRVRGNGQRGWRWALRDVSLEVAPGESVGIVGLNGSGKSTFLKILTQVMYPYAGSVEVSGRVAALIELRAGIHPDLTGRENIYLYGSLLGLRRAGVARRFDDIVAFAELADAIDRQVKFYSSGMQMRLAFSVAAYLQPDVLLVDEVLAVGDATFQQKCLDRMQTLLREGVTLVFVSHDLASVEALCTRGLWLHDGAVAHTGPVREVLAAYRHHIEELAHSAAGGPGLLTLRATTVSGAEGAEARSQQPLEIATTVESRASLAAAVCFGLSEGPATPVVFLQRELYLRAGETRVSCRLAQLPLPRGRFSLWLGIFDRRGEELLPWHPVAQVDILGPELDAPPRGIVRLAPVHVEGAWQVE